MKHCWANYLLAIVIAVLGVGSMLSACGRKGPLYLPKEEPQAKQQKVVKPQDKKEQDKKEQEENKTN